MNREARKRFMIRGPVVNTGQFAAIEREIQRRLMLNHYKSHGKLGAIVSGEPNTGKTTTVTHIARRFERRRRDTGRAPAEGDAIPVIYVSVPPSCTPKLMLGEFAHFLGVPVRPHHNTGQLMNTVATVIAACGTELIIVDEIHNLSQRFRQAGEASDTLKQLSEKCPGTFVYAGVNVESCGLLEGTRGRQISSRFQLMPLTKFANTGKAKPSWADLPFAVEDSLGLVDQPPGDMLRHADQLHQQTGGVIGDLTGMLHMLAMDAIDDGSERLDLDTIYGTKPPKPATAGVSRVTRTSVASVRPLPVSVRPLGGETVTGYAGRLAQANGIASRDLRLHVRDLAALSATHTDLERAAPWVERLGRLRAGHFAADLRRQSMHVRCARSEWRPWPCPDCGYPQEPRTACLRCAHGHPTTVRSRGGAICNRHGRWHVNGHDVDVSGLPEYQHAERCLSGTLWKRGISLTTGELQLAAALIGHWAHDNAPTRWMQRRSEALGIDANMDDAVLLFAYPEVVALTAVLTDMSFASYLLTSRFRLVQQVTALEAAVIGVVEGGANRSLHELAERIVTTAARRRQQLGPGLRPIKRRLAG